MKTIKYYDNNGNIIKEYTQAEAEKLKEINACKKQLAALDYIGVKIATGRATVEEYASEIAEMNRLAARINELSE